MHPILVPYEAQFRSNLQKQFAVPLILILNFIQLLYIIGETYTPTINQLRSPNVIIRCEIYLFHFSTNFLNLTCAIMYLIQRTSPQCASYSQFLVT